MIRNNEVITTNSRNESEDVITKTLPLKRSEVSSACIPVHLQFYKGRVFASARIICILMQPVTCLSAFCLSVCLSVCLCSCLHAFLCVSWCAYLCLFIHFPLFAPPPPLSLSLSIRFARPRVRSAQLSIR